MQTTGRAGRDSANSNAILFFNNEDIGKPTVTPEIKEYCRIKTCRRVYLCQYFGTTSSFSGVYHRCCDNCALQCDCDECVMCKLVAKMEVASQEKAIHSVDVEMRMFNALTQIFACINGKVHHPIDPRLLTCLTESLATQVSSQYESFASENELQVHFPEIKSVYINVIYQILSSCKTIDPPHAS